MIYPTDDQRLQAKNLVLEELKKSELSVTTIIKLLRIAEFPLPQRLGKEIAWALVEEGAADFNDKWYLELKEQKPTVPPDILCTGIPPVPYVSTGVSRPGKAARKTMKTDNEPSIEELKAQLEEARKTNRRLNRRCQQLESDLNRADRLYASAFKEIEQAAWRAKNYAKEIRDLYRQEKSYLHKLYREHWERLPKPENTWRDGIEIRVNEALRIISEQQTNSNP